MKIPAVIAVTAFSLNAMAEVRTFSGDAGETVLLDSPIEETEGVAFTSTFVRSSRTLDNVFPPCETQQLLQNARVAEWRVSGGKLATTDGLDASVTVCNPVRRDDSLEVQLQAKDGNVISCLKVRMSQNGDDIDITPVYARKMDVSSNTAGVGVNFDAIPVSATGSALSCAVDYAADAWSLSSLTLEQIGEPAVFNLAAAMTPGGAVTVADNAALVVSGEGSVDGGAITDPLVVEGTLVYAGREQVVSLSGGLSGGADSTLVLGTDQRIQTATVGSLSTTETTVQNAWLWLIRSFSNLAVSGLSQPGVYFLQNDGSAATMQVQAYHANDRYTASCYVTMTQSGDDIKVKQTKARYLSGNHLGENFDELTTQTWNYSVTGMTLVMDPAASLSFGKVSSDTSQTIANAKLSNILGFSNVKLSGSERSGAFFLSKDGTGLTVQFQQDIGVGTPNAYTACCYVKFVQSGTGIRASFVKARYVYFKDAPGGTSYFGKNFDDITSSVWSYNLTSAKLLMAPATTFSLSGTGNSVGRIVVSTNAVLNVAANSLPVNGTVEIGTNATLSLAARSSGQQNRTFIVHQGGQLVQGANEVFNSPLKTRFILDGGSVQFSRKSGDSFDSDSYVNYFDFANGGKVEGFRPMLLGYGDGYLTVRGEKPVEWSCGGILVGGWEASNQWHLYLTVEDVDGGDEADFVMSGNFKDYSSPDTGKFDVNHRCHINKRGAGTWRIDTAIPNTCAWVHLEEGKLLLNANNALINAGVLVAGGGDGIYLEGGTLASSAATSNSLVAVTLKKSSTIEVAKDAVFVFGDSSSLTWTDGATLNVVGDVEAKSVRFGTKKSALTVKQRAALRLNGKRATLDGNGYVGEKPGMCLIVR